MRNEWYLPNSRINKRHINEVLDLGIIMRDLTPDETGQVRLAVQSAIKMSSMVLDLFCWDRLESFDSFNVALEMAPFGSSGFQFRRNHLIMDKVRAFVLGSKVKASNKTLETKIRVGLRHLTNNGRDLKDLNRLLDPEPFDFPYQEHHSQERLNFWKRWSSSRNPDLTIRYHHRIIQRLPRAQQLIRNIITELYAPGVLQARRAPL